MSKVYIRVDAENRIKAINSDDFVTDTSGWIQIDEGRGDKYHHAQSNYLPLPLVNEHGALRYKYTDGKVIERTESEIAPEVAEAEIPTATRQKIVDYLTQARMNNKTFLDIASPTASDRNAQIVKLTRQNIRIMRLLLNDLADEE